MNSVFGLQFRTVFRSASWSFARPFSFLASPSSGSTTNRYSPIFGARDEDRLISALQPTSVTGSQPIRTRMKDYFRIPNEKKRIQKHGWKTRMQTPGGRAIIMRRMLKGKHALTH